MNIEKVAVIGAGVMGAGIAAQIANAGKHVYLLDIVPDSATSVNRNLIAETAIKKLLKAKPAALMHKKNARLITPGNIEDHIDWLSDVDWVIEAVIEHLPVKQSVYKKLQQVCRPDCIISSNTSTLPLAQLTSVLSESWHSRFLITHFFNPPRYMRLLEIVSRTETDTDCLNSLVEFAEQQLGKGCVHCHDSPGFIANRIGIYWLLCGMHEAINQGLRVEEADVLMSIPFSMPKTGVFGLLDLVGLDLVPHILASMQSLPADDAFFRINQFPDFCKKMVAEGYTGRKGKGGFYRLNQSNGKRVKESIDLKTGEYSESKKPDLACLKLLKQEGLKHFLLLDNQYSQYARTVITKTLDYAAGLVPEVADNIIQVDRAMQYGYNWKYGPFELMDLIGVDTLADQLNWDGLDSLRQAKSFYREDSSDLQYRNLNGDYQRITKAEIDYSLSDYKRGHQPLISNQSASLWDVGDGVACVEFHSKMNTFDLDILNLLQASIAEVEKGFSALLIHNDADNFSAGANLGLLLHALTQSDWQAVSDIIKLGQKTFMALKYAPFPVVAAPSGLALGGGCEILLHCDAIQAHAELYTGLVEVGVGLVPGWGGCKELLRRNACIKMIGGPVPPVVKAFETIGMAKVSGSAAEAKDMLILSADDGIIMNKNHLLYAGKQKAMALAENYQAAEATEFHLPGQSVKTLLTLSVKAMKMLRQVTPYDAEVADALATVLTGGDTDFTETLSEQDVLDLECKVFTGIVQNQGTQARLEHMLKTGKPLRN